MKKIIFINPGPTFNAHSESYRAQYLKLSSIFSGYIWTTAPKKEKFYIGKFEFQSVKRRFGFLYNVAFLLFAVKRAFFFRVFDINIDLVTTYDPLKTGLIGLLVARITGARFAPEVNGVYTSPAEWLDEPSSLVTKVKKRCYPILMKFVLKNADAIKLLFEKQVDVFEDVCRNKLIRSFPCYVPTSHFRELREEKEVLFVGFPFRRKGVDILIKAFKKVASKYPDWKLKILGWFPDPEELEQAIDGHPQIYHHPPVYYDEMPAHIGSCAILVLPSRSEAMGRVLVEAMAAGKPRIGSNVDGIPTVIRDGVDGLLCEPCSIEDLANKLDLLIGNPGLRKKLGKAGQIRARNEFSEIAYIDNLVNFYNDVIEG